MTILYSVHELLTYCIVITNYDNVITYIFKLLSMTDWLEIPAKIKNPAGTGTGTGILS